MNTTAKDVSNPQLNTIFLGVAFFWSTVIVALAAWNYRQSYTSTVEVARSSANQSYSKDLVYRRWATVHGGVYRRRQNIRNRLGNAQDHRPKRGPDNERPHREN